MGWRVDSTPSSGIKFVIGPHIADGTNLSTDTGLSVEWMPHMPSCTAYPFLISPTTVVDETVGDVDYSVGSIADAAAGNRYEETIYAVKGTDPCIAIRYFIHYGAIENYPQAGEPGAVKEFDRAGLSRQFDTILRSLSVTQ
jgi:hypothetical protein